MNVDLVRSIDRHVGIPACLILSFIYRFFSLILKKTPKTSAPKRFLFLELSEMGSAILAYPAMRYTLEKYHPARLYFLIFEQNRFSVELLKIIPPDRVFTISTLNPIAFIRTTLRTIMAIRAAEIDVVFDLELFSRFSALLTGVSGAAVRVGYRRYHEEGLYRGSFFTHPVAYNCHQHMSKNFLALVKSIEHGTEHPLVKEVMPEPYDVPICRPAPEDAEKIMRRITGIYPKIADAKHLVAINPSAGELLPIRAWPIENYIQLIGKILETFEAVIVMIGLEDASRHARQISAVVGSQRCIDMTGKTSMTELLALLSQASLLITADSGPAHFASLTDNYCVVLFGPETPDLYTPLGLKSIPLFAGLSCSPCLSAYNHRKTSCRDARCMAAITVDQVFEVASGVLKSL